MTEPKSTRRPAVRIPCSPRVGYLALSPSERRIAWASNNSVHIWDISGRREICELQANGSARKLSFSNDGRYLAAGIPQQPGVPRGSVSVWNIESRQPVQQIDTRYESGVLAFSPDGRYLAFQEEHGLITLCDLAKGGQLNEVDVPYAVESAAFSPDGRVLALSFGFTLRPNPGLVLWDVRHGRPASRVPGPGPRGQGFCLAFSSDGRYLAAGEYRNAVCIWEMRPSGLLRGPGARFVARIEVDGDTENMLAFGSDGRHLIVVDDAGGCLRVSAVPTGRKVGHLEYYSALRTLPDNPTQQDVESWRAAENWGMGEALSSDGRIFAISWWEEMYIWQTGY